VTLLKIPGLDPFLGLATALVEQRTQLWLIAASPDTPAEVRTAAIAEVTRASKVIDRIEAWIAELKEESVMK
jgi:hypothetical protein